MTLGRAWLAIAASAFLCSPGVAQVTDGDTLKQGGVTYRLWGIDAPDAKQVCPDGWPAGSLATTMLQAALTAGLPPGRSSLVAMLYFTPALVKQSSISCQTLQSTTCHQLVCRTCRTGF